MPILPFPERKPDVSDFQGAGSLTIQNVLPRGDGYRVQWSGLNALTTWDNVTAQSNFQDLADGGLTRGVAGGDQYGIVFQDSAIRSMTFNPGSPTVFDILKVSSSDGMFAPYSAVNAGGQTYFCSTQGFKSIAPGGSTRGMGCS